MFLPFVLSRNFTVFFISLFLIGLFAATYVAKRQKQSGLVQEHKRLLQREKIALVGLLKTKKERRRREGEKVSVCECKAQRLDSRSESANVLATLLVTARCVTSSPVIALLATDIKHRREMLIQSFSEFSDAYWEMADALENGI